MEAKDEFDSFCKELKIKTQAIHDQSDRTINLKLAVVLTDTKLWATAVANFYFVFQTLEQCIETNSGHAILGQLNNKQLFRSKQFEDDLEFYLGRTWRAQIQISDEARDYCDRLMQLSDENPTLLVAYVHSMYLALLSGGQIIRRIVKRTLGLTSDEGLSVFNYEPDSKLKLKAYIIDTIDKLELSREDKDCILKEKIKCFQMNNAIANSIKPSLASYKRIIQLSIAVLTILLIIFVLLYKLIF